GRVAATAVPPRVASPGRAGDKKKIVAVLLVAVTTDGWANGCRTRSSAKDMARRLWRGTIVICYGGSLVSGGVGAGGGGFEAPAMWGGGGVFSIRRDAGWGPTDR